MLQPHGQPRHWHEVDARPLRLELDIVPHEIWLRPACACTCRVRLGTRIVCCMRSLQQLPLPASALRRLRPRHLRSCPTVRDALSQGSDASVVTDSFGDVAACLALGCSDAVHPGRTVPVVAGSPVDNQISLLCPLWPLLFLAAIDGVARLSRALRTRGWSARKVPLALAAVAAVAALVGTVTNYDGNWPLGPMLTGDAFRISEHATK